nr:hypothetical protein [Tanacetum cinerariifolium]
MLPKDAYTVAPYETKVIEKYDRITKTEKQSHQRISNLRRSKEKRSSGGQSSFPPSATGDKMFDNILQSAWRSSLFRLWGARFRGLAFATKETEAFRPPSVLTCQKETEKIPQRSAWWKGQKKAKEKTQTPTTSLDIQSILSRCENLEKEVRSL